MFGRSNITVLTISDILIRYEDIYSSPTKILFIIAFLAASTNPIDGIFICCTFFHSFHFSCFSYLFLSLLYAPSSDDSNLLMLLLLLLYCFSRSDNTSLRVFFARFFQTKVGPIGVSSIVSLYIRVGLSSIGARIVVKD